MFGFTVEKLFLIVLIAAVVIGPRRLPLYAGRLAETIRRITTVVRETGRRVEQDTGVAVLRDDWRSLDPRRYDPRRIIREAWAEADAPLPDAEADAPVVDAALPDAAVVEAPPVDAPPVDAPPAGAPAGDAPAGRWVVTGSSAHPRRTWVPDPAVPASVLAAASS